VSASTRPNPASLIYDAPLLQGRNGIGQAQCRFLLRALYTFTGVRTVSCAGAGLERMRRNAVDSPFRRTAQGCRDNRHSLFEGHPLVAGSHVRADTVSGARSLSVSRISKI
jgi:hypothetical protein